jgi:hypothetical protein
LIELSSLLMMPLPVILMTITLIVATSAMTFLSL